MFIRALLKLMVLPPGFQFILIVLGLLMWKVRRRLATFLLVFSFASLVLVSMPVFTAFLYGLLEEHPAISPADLAQFKGRENTVIVILGGGRETLADEYGDETVSPQSLTRIRYGAFVAKYTELPILVTAGDVFGDGSAESDLMAAVLQEYGFGKVMIERQSKTTWENAKYTADILSRNGVTDVLLVTESWHMRRGVYSFEQFGFNVIPAPTMLRTKSPPIRRYFPSAKALYHSSNALQEWMGLMVYSLFYDAAPSELVSSKRSDNANETET